MLSGETWMLPLSSCRPMMAVNCVHASVCFLLLLTPFDLWGNTRSGGSPEEEVAWLEYKDMRPVALHAFGAVHHISPKFCLLLP